MDYKQHIKNLLIQSPEEILRTNKYKSSVALVDILEEEINNFNFSETNDITYLFNMFDILVINLKDNEQLQNTLNDRFTLIHNNIRNLIHAKPNEMNKNELTRYRLLLNIIKKMENTMLVIYYESPTDYDPNKEEFIYYILFKLKYINFFKLASEKFPHIISQADENGKPLIEKILEKYLESLDIYLSKENLGPIDDLIYYDKALTYVFENKNINIDDYNKKIMLEKISTFYKNQNYTDNRRKEKLSFFINNVINIINNTKVEDTIDYLSYKYEIHTKFKEAHNLEAKSIYLINNEEMPITTNKKIYTFDGEGACEIDDGLSLEYENGIYHLGVHIADPGSYIPQNSILMDEAYRRTTSRYIGDFCIPLFPFILSADIMSLNESKSRYCMSYYFDIDSITGELINFKVANEICKIEKNLTYDYFDKTIDNGTEDKIFFDFLIKLSNLSEILKKIYNEDSIYKEFHHNKDSSLSHSVIESAMIYTNYNLAKYASEHNLPFIYRCHNINKGDIEKLSKLQDRLKQKNNTDDIIKNIELIKNMFPRAKYSSKNTGHYGLGIDYYSHVTSPLRRLADNIANICIKEYIIKNNPKKNKEEMIDYIDELAETINSKRASGDDYDIQYARIRTSNN